MSVIDLSFTTVKQELPDFIYQKLSSYSSASNSYHHQPDELRTMIAKKHEINISFISLTAGADQAITILSALYGRQGHIFTPTYISYSDVKRFGTLTEYFSLNNDSYDVPISTIKDGGLIFIANPNNPAGITSREKILELVKNNPDSIVVVDEAYGDFAGESVISDVPSYSNLVVLRSYSKGYALAGFRIGYMVASPDILDNITLESTWFNVAYTSVGAAVAAMEHEVYFTQMRKDIIGSREHLQSHLSQAGYKIIPSYINAVLIKFDDEKEATNFVNILKTKEIVVNQGNGASNIGLDKSFVRISIGNQNQMEILQQTIN